METLCLLLSRLMRDAMCVMSNVFYWHSGISFDTCHSVFTQQLHSLSGGLKIYDKDKVKGEIFLYSWIISLFSYSCIAAWCRAESYQMLSRQFSLISHFQILTHFSFSRFHSRLRKLWFLALKPFPYLGKMRFFKNLQLAKSCFNVRWRCCPNRKSNTMLWLTYIKMMIKITVHCMTDQKKTVKNGTIYNHRSALHYTINQCKNLTFLNISYQNSIK